MHLLSTNTYKLTEFQGKIPPYAILSHMWQREEVTFRDITDLDKAKEMQGFAKIVGACNTAKRDGFEYIWIDTCCINKESSAELSEAINSMYAWYKNAHACYAYLWDVPSEGDHTNPPSLFAMSLWFTRSWTLQELIAPQRMIFYGSDWVDIGTKASLHEVISAVTGISTEVITGGISLGDVPVAVRMSWAADRNTTREEDVAYSLMGIFDVNMPLLYGEGKKAFIRLQHEIIKKSNDHSIFAWTTDGDKPRGILACSPREFLRSGKIEQISQPYLGDIQTNDHIMNSPPPYSITNQGLHIKLPVMIMGDETLAFLNCRLSGKADPIAITLEWSHHLQQYIRSKTTLLESAVKGSVRLSSLCIADDIANDLHTHIIRPRPFLSLELKMPPNCAAPDTTRKGFSPSTGGQAHLGWHFVTDSPLTSHAPNILVFNEHRRFKPFAVVVGAQESGVEWCDILTDPKPEIIAAYCTPSRVDTRRTMKLPFLDRASASLTNGWSVTVSLALPSNRGFRVRGKVEITRSRGQLHPAPPLARPSGETTYLVIPPTPQHGFVVDVDDLRRASPHIHLDQHLHSIILSTSNSEPQRLPFKSTTTKEMFYLVLRPGFGQLYSSIEKVALDGGIGYISQAGNGAETYNVILDNGNSVFVMQRECKVTSVADYIITLSI